MPPTLESEYTHLQMQSSSSSDAVGGSFGRAPALLLDPAAPTVSSNPTPVATHRLIECCIISEHTTQPKMLQTPKTFGFRKHGIRWSEFWRLPYWDPSMSTVVDPINGLYEGLYQQSLVRDVYRKRFGASPTSTNSN
ncbi:hypothetical protein B0H12DRAFT_1243508 [Mycena haematopus]|nr:hypothetical protein B0H12DRAFT_1243508 [Mycena haematopus]